MHVHVTLSSPQFHTIPIIVCGINTEGCFLANTDVNNAGFIAVKAFNMFVRPKGYTQSFWGGKKYLPTKYLFLKLST